MNILNYRNIAICGVLLTACVLLASCSGSDGDAAEAPATTTDVDDNSIRFNANVWRMIQGAPRRATTYDNAAALQGETEGFRAFIYNAGTTTSYNSGGGSVVKWETDKWVFQDGKHYWPASGNLDFFAYMPATGVGYVSGVTYAATPDVTFTCTGLTAAEQDASLKEFVYAIKTGQNKDGQGASGVTLNFQHPFARVNLQWASYDHSGITLNSIKFKGIKNNGTYSHTGGWTPGGENVDFTVTTLAENGAALPYLVVPQAWAGEIEVNASWNDWGDSPVAHTLTKTIPVTWAAGTSYTYTFTISPDDLTVNTTNYTEQW